MAKPISLGIIMLIAGASAASAANLVLPHDRYGNKEGCELSLIHI